MTEESSQEKRMYEAWSRSWQRFSRSFSISINFIILVSYLFIFGPFLENIFRIRIAMGNFNNVKFLLQSKICYYYY